MHVFKTVLDDDSFKHIFRKDKNEVSNCDVKDRNIPLKSVEEMTAAPGIPGVPGLQTSHQSLSGKSFPKSEVFVSVASDHGVGSCANHAQFFEDGQLRSLYNLGNIRGGEFNPNEPEDAKYRIKKRDEAFRNKARDAWDSMVRQRSKSRFNSGSSEENN
jgi:hypothetical protein